MHELPAMHSFLCSPTIFFTELPLNISALSSSLSSHVSSLLLPRSRVVLLYHSPITHLSLCDLGVLGCVDCGLSVFVFGLFSCRLVLPSVLFVMVRLVEWWWAEIFVVRGGGVSCRVGSRPRVHVQTVTVCAFEDAQGVFNVHT